MKTQVFSGPLSSLNFLADNFVERDLGGKTADKNTGSGGVNMFITETKPDQPRTRQTAKESSRDDGRAKRRLVVGFNMYTAQMDMRRRIDPMEQPAKKGEF